MSDTCRGRCVEGRTKGGDGRRISLRITVSDGSLTRQLSRKVCAIDGLIHTRNLTTSVSQVPPLVEELMFEVGPGAICIPPDTAGAQIAGHAPQLPQLLRSSVPSVSARLSDTHASVHKQDIYANPFAGDVLESILGPRPKLIYLNGNTALVSKLRQDVHGDLEWRHPHAPFALTISIYTVETNEVNGSTEWWLGSHRNTSIADHRKASESRVSPV